MMAVRFILGLLLETLARRGPDAGRDGSGRLFGVCPVLHTNLQEIPGVLINARANLVGRLENAHPGDSSQPGHTRGHARP